MRNRCAVLDLDLFFQRFPDLSLRPSDRGRVVIAGTIGLEVRHEARDLCLRDEYFVEMEIAEGFPDQLPLVREIGGRIPKDFHKLTNDRLCLATPLRLQVINARTRSLVSFVEMFVLPYLAGYTIFEKTREMPFGELAHGIPGLYDDYRSLLGVATDEECSRVLGCLSHRKREANKEPCFCGSGVRLGRCHNRKVNALRVMTSRGHFGGALASLRLKTGT